MCSAAGLAGCQDGEQLLDSTWTEIFKDSSKNRRPSRLPNFEQSLPSKHLSNGGPRNASIGTDELLGRGPKAEKWHETALGTKEAFPPSLIWACVKSKDLSRGTRLHNELLQKGLDEEVYSAALVTMYAKCGQLQKAQTLLDTHKCSSSIPWTALTASYAREGHGQMALDCYENMQSEGIAPDAVTYSCILKACAMIGAIGKGKKIHDEILRQGLLEHDIVLGGALVDMYAKCGALCQARSVLEKLPSRNVVAWNALITGYAQGGHGEQALECLKRMQGEGIVPDAVTFVCLLKACAAIKAMDAGKQIHNEILRRNLLKHEITLGGALVDMYAKCGALSEAQTILESLLYSNVVSWNALIAGYVQIGQGQQALNCFTKMQLKGIHPDAVTYTSILKSCAMIPALDVGMQIHKQISREGLLEHDVVLGGALVDMYAKCGALTQAQSALEKLPLRDVVSWGALISGYAQEGQGEHALECFEQMQREGISPDRVTFLCLLHLCGHLGLVKRGQELFDCMKDTYGVNPDLECFTCMVDLLGRAGNLVKAAELIQDMPFAADSAIWHCLLCACCEWADVSVGTWAFEKALELDKCDGASYVLMVNICAAAGMLEKAKAIEVLRIQNKAWKPPGCDLWADINNTVHNFCFHDNRCK